ncbi:hypothetical protein F4810DRAFT_476092 [Camillea tinctor]|nr:hypothetical protein F4810DRAFT_476092 [Camillea tinctor]
MAGGSAEKTYDNLKNSNSRWRTRRAINKETKINKARDRYNVLLYVKGLRLVPNDDGGGGSTASQGGTGTKGGKGGKGGKGKGDDDDKTDSEKLSTKGGLLKIVTKDGKNICDELCNLVHDSRKISRDYEVSGGTTTRVTLRGNVDAGTLIREMDELIDLAATYYSDPDDLRDWMREAFERRFRGSAFDNDATHRAKLDRTLGWTEDWAQARYRFFNHYLRDEPWWCVEYLEEEQRIAGQGADHILHDADLTGDSAIIESKWFRDRDQLLYQRTYRMSIHDGAILRRVIERTNAAGLRSFFEWSVGVVNRYVDWRTELCRCIVRTARTTMTHEQRNVHTVQYRTNMDRLMEGWRPRVQHVDNALDDFSRLLVAVGKQANTNGKISLNKYNAMRNRFNILKHRINHFDVRDPAFATFRFWREDTMNWPQEREQPGPLNLRFAIVPPQVMMANMRLS